MFVYESHGHGVNLAFLRELRCLPGGKIYLLGTTAEVRLRAGLGNAKMIR